MQLFKSLFCLVGRDNGYRFASIQLLSYLLSIILINLFDPYLIVKLVLLTFILPVVGLSSLRRVRDAGLTITLSLVPGILFLLVMLTIVLVAHPLAYWLLGLSVAVVTMFSLLTSQIANGKRHILGYSGPIDLTELLAPTPAQLSQRVEPSFAGAVNISQDNNTTAAESVAKSQDIPAVASLKYQWLTWFSQNNKLIFIAFSLVLLCILLFTWLSLSPEQTQAIEQEQVTEKPKAKLSEERFNQLTMDDDFLLATNQYNGLVISWAVSGAAGGEVWSIVSAKGKPGCDAIVFDNGQAYRTITVEVKDNYYHAYFSPLDAMATVKDLAYRNTFKLCDFDFSLKGSQKQLMSVDTYANWLN